MSHCNNPQTESTLDPPYGEIQEIYGKQETTANVKRNKLSSELSDRELS